MATDHHAGTSTGAFEAELALVRRALGDVLVAEGHPGLAEATERLESVGGGDDAASAAAMVAAMDDREAAEVAQALSVQLHLINLVEERHHARLLRLEESDESAAPDSLWPALADGDHRAALERLEIHPVLTAHPTEARRRAVVAAIARVGVQLDRVDDLRNGPAERAVAMRRLTEEVEILWRTAPLRQTRPGPLDEVRTAVGVFERTLARIVPRLYRAAERAIDPTTAGRVEPVVPAFVRFGSWIGGDRDGNPSVTAHVTREAMAIQADAALHLLEDQTLNVARTLTLDERWTPPSPELVDRLAMDAATFPAIAAEARRGSPAEPHRVKMLVIAARVAATRARDMDVGYASPDELLTALRLVQRSLAAAGAARAAYGELQNLIWQVETFGFHLAELEVRQHSRVHAEAIAQLFAASPSLGGADPGDPVLLDRLATEGWPERSPDVGSEAEEVLATLRVMAMLQQRWGPGCCGRYIVSFTQSATDLAAVAALGRAAGGSTPPRLEVVPLFETHDDLHRAEGILDAWLSLPGAAARSAGGSGRIELMVGYSDSAKDVGPCSAALTLSETQRRLVEWARSRDLQLTLFHGRGGSLGRGGGPVHRAILAQPPGSVAGRFKVTEQGEVIAARYANATVGQGHLERVTSAVLQADTAAVSEVNTVATQRFDGLAATVEEISRLTYRDLVRTDGFADFMATVTPLEEIGELRLGSRPPKRAGALVGRTLDDLRAIPWVFSWSQARINLAGWYGIGAGIAAVADLDLVRAAYAEWPLFAMMVDTAEMSLAKADRGIAAAYLAQAGRDDLTTTILDEFDRSTQMVLATVGASYLLEHKPRLREGFDRRRPAVGALSHLQLRALQAVRGAVAAGHDPGPHAAQLLVTVNGVAAGLQNTG